MYDSLPIHKEAKGIIFSHEISFYVHGRILIVILHLQLSRH